MKKKSIRRKKTVVNLHALLIITFLILLLSMKKFLYFKTTILNPNQPNLQSELNNLKISYFFNKKELANKIFSFQPEIIKVKFKPNYFTSKMEIAIQNEKIVAEICSTKCFWLGEHGYIFSKSQTSNLKSQNAFAIISSLKINENTILEPKIISALGKIFELSNLENIPLKFAEILTNQDLKITTKSGWYILIDPNQNIDKQINKLNFFIDNKKESINTLQYLDLRIPQRIYYK
jgi:hypothetical protein